MFREVLFEVSKLALLLPILLIAFGFGFHIMLSEQVSTNDICVINMYNVKFISQKTFETGWWSVIQTFAMMVGELNYGGIVAYSFNLRRP